MKLYYVHLFLGLLTSLDCLAQSVNGYAQVTSITSGSILSVANVNETHDTFEVGEQVIIMQVQDDVLGVTTNTADFGNVGSIQSAGYYEIATIQSVSESGGVPTSITLAAIPLYTYNTCTNCRVQLITYPTLDDGLGNYTTTSDLTADAWNGSYGGIIAFRVTDTLFLAHNIRADGAGFRGGVANPTSRGGDCNDTEYRTNSGIYAEKGESIYLVDNATYTYGRGKILNGGGGGNTHNAGGGGGGNYTSGGAGGEGWNSGTCTSGTGGGLSGIDLSDYISGDRVFMGGGGGGGQQNNGRASDGENGGGIILISATTIATSTCAGFEISADGNNSSGSTAQGNDGAGGAGAGGSIVIAVNNWDLNCGLSVTANGGSGGNVNYPAAHGGGGGGGRGVILFSSTVTGVPNLTTSVTEGSGGQNGTSGGSSNAGDGNTSPSSPTADPDGVIETTGSLLPVSLLYWRAQPEENLIHFEWATSSEINNDFFTIEYSIDGNDWQRLARISGAGNSNDPKHYSYINPVPHHGDWMYVRLSQTDFDGTSEVFNTLMIDTRRVRSNWIIAPNPSVNLFYIQGVTEGTMVYLYDLEGRKMSAAVSYENGKMKVDISNLRRGTYVAVISSGAETQTYRVLKK